jgi:glycosyl transferase family 1
MAERRFQRVFVMGAYLPNGGTLMAYHIGRILDRDFGIRAIGVRIGAETPDNGVHSYNLHMPMMSLAEMEREITDTDILVVNPSFSAHQFGWRLPGFKLCYVQGFSTYALLDLKFDHYIAVSDFVANYLRCVYSIDTRVIPPFINLDQLPQTPVWADRPANLVLPFRKGMPEVWNSSWRRLREILAENASVTFADPIESGAIPQAKLLARIGETRYLLTLSAAEGFGLVPLEAMAMGTMVIGYDGFGGRHYMRPNENCAVVPFPQIEHVAEQLLDAISNPERSAEIAQRGRETAAAFSYPRFRESWIEELSRILNMQPTSAS